MALPQPVLDLIAKSIGEALVSVGEQIEDETSQKLSRPYPPASTPGDYPRSRSGRLARGVVTSPTVPEEAYRQRAVKVGYSKDVPYGGTLELRRARLGIGRTARTIRVWRYQAK